MSVFLWATLLWAAELRQKQVVNFDTPIYVNQLSTISSFDVNCAGPKATKAAMHIQVGHYVDSTDGFQIFTGGFTARLEAGKKSYAIGHADEGEATIQIDGNILAANLLARSTGDSTRARKLLYDGRVTSFLVNDNVRALTLNIEQPRPWRVVSFDAKQISLVIDELSLEVSDVRPVAEKKPPRRLFQGPARCQLKINFIDL